MRVAPPGISLRGPVCFVHSFPRPLPRSISHLPALVVVSPTYASLLRRESALFLCVYLCAVLLALHSFVWLPSVALGLVYRAALRGFAVPGVSCSSSSVAHSASSRHPPPSCVLFRFPGPRLVLLPRRARDFVSFKPRPALPSSPVELSLGVDPASRRRSRLLPSL